MSARAAVPACTVLAMIAVWLVSAALLVACGSPAGDPAVATATATHAAPSPESGHDASPPTPTPPLPGATTAAPDRGSPATTPALKPTATSMPGTPAATPIAAATPGTPAATPTATATPDVAAPAPTAESAARPSGGVPDVTRGPDSVGAGVRAPAPAEGEQLYTWQDGEHTRQVWLQPPDDTRASDEDGASGRSPSRASTSSSPVFRDDSGRLMTLPGGVLVVLDPEWDQSRTAEFFAANGIAPGRVDEEDFATNAFFISTDPGLPSLQLANELADEEGVLISSPNWRSQVVLR